jgi:uncharacterized protein
MRVLIIGATGFIGRELVKELQQSGHHLIAVSRNAWKAREILGSRIEILEWDGVSRTTMAVHLSGMDALINLAGESIASGRWNDRRKKLIIDSRIKTGHMLAEAIEMSTSKLSVLIQGSATGFYGTPVNGPANESGSAGTGFLADLTNEWESSVKALEHKIPRIVIIRTGLVLGKDGGLLEKTMLPFRFYSGTVIGSGRQWLSWIHIRDEVRAIRFLLENSNSSGPYNLTAPNPVRMKAFITCISEITGKPAWLKVPGFFLKAALGEMAEQTVLSSQNIYPGKLLKEGFRFEYPHLETALKNLLT